MTPTRTERDHKNRWCFRCETWRDLEPWSTSWGGCRCPTCEYVTKVASPFFETLKCSVCGRLCEGVADEKGRLGCSYECAYKIGHVPRDIMLQYAGRKWPAARSNQDAAPYEHAKERAEAYRRGAEAMREACALEVRGRFLGTYSDLPRIEVTVQIEAALLALPIPGEP